jgi:hypothetical protein
MLREAEADSWPSRSLSSISKTVRVRLGEIALAAGVRYSKGIDGRAIASAMTGVRDLLAI